MNVPLPFQDAAHAFWVIIVAMLGIVVGVAVFFRRRGWL
jgi:magnesium transporter